MVVNYVHLIRKNKKAAFSRREKQGMHGVISYFLPLGLPCAYSHQLRSVQRSQSGLRAAQTRLPWKMIQ